MALLGYTDDSLLDEMVDAIAVGNGAAVFGTVDRVVEGGHDPRRFAADLLDRLRDLIILAAVPGAGQSGLLDAPADRLERMAEQAGRFGQAELTRAAEIISEGLIQMRGTASPRLLLELMCAQVLLPAASTGEKALLARLERLEHQLAAVESGASEPAGSPAAARDVRPEAAPPGDAPTGAAPSARRPRPAAAAEGPAPGDEAPGGEGRARPATSSEPTDAQAGPGEPATGGGRSQRAASQEGPAAGRAVGPVDVEVLRQHWPEILDQVRDERKVAWMLLNTASVQDLQNGVLTITFPSEGNARGFASSGHDQVLTSALAAMLGLNVRVKAVVGGPPAPGPAAAGRPAQGRTAHGHSPADPAAASSPAPGRSASGASSPDPPVPGTPGESRPESRARRSAAAPDTGRSARGAKAPGAPPAGPPAPSGRQAGTARSRLPQPQAAAPADEEWPDEASEATSSGAGLSGMELIRRQLGGRVIEEIEDS